MSKKRRVFTVVIAALILLTLGFIWGNSLLSENASSTESEAAHAFLKDFLDAVFGKDVITSGVLRKLAHGAEFFVLGAEVCALYALIAAPKTTGYLQLLQYGVYVAVIDESLQLLSSRGAEVKDVLIDFGGYVCATVIFIAVTSIVKLIKNKKAV